MTQATDSTHSTLAPTHELRIRKAGERGFADHGWLRSFHTFSFADYYDPKHMGFRALRVINEDRVAPSAGFPTHPHRDMEILSYVLGGGLEHRDSMGNGSVIRPGDVQRMSAGTGVFHSEFNASDREPVHFLQIWLLPGERGIRPGYEQKSFPSAERRGRLLKVASPDGADGSVTLHQDAVLYAGLFDQGETGRYDLAADRHAWLHVARGEAKVDGHVLVAGDAVALSPIARGPGAASHAVQIEGVHDAEVLLFDLA